MGLWAQAEIERGGRWATLSGRTPHPFGVMIGSECLRHPCHFELAREFLWKPEPDDRRRRLSSGFFGMHEVPFAVKGEMPLWFFPGDAPAS